MTRTHHKKKVTKTLDICVLTAGKFDLLRKCLDAIMIASKDIPCNIYLLDNGSPIESKVFNDDLFPQDQKKYIWKRLNKNIGYPGGANTVINMGTAPLVLFVSDDVVLEPSAIKNLLATMKDPIIGLCGLKLIFPKDSSDPARPAGKVQHIGHSMTLKGEVIHPFLGWSADNPKTKVSGERFSVTGASFIVRRDVFRRVGGFNLMYGSGTFEDVELALFIKAAGYKIWVDCDAIAEHYVGATASMRNEGFPFEQNRQIFITRNRPNFRWTDWEIR